MGITHPEKELKYFISDSKIGSILYSSNYGNYNVTNNMGNNSSNGNSSENSGSDNNSNNSNNIVKNVNAVNMLNLNVPLFDLANETLTSNLTLTEIQNNTLKNNTISRDNNSYTNNDISKIRNLQNNVRNNYNQNSNLDDNNNNTTEINLKRLKEKKEQDLVGLSDALILYTSGTTGRPKGVIHTREVRTFGLYYILNILPTPTWRSLCVVDILSSFLSSQ